MKLSGKPGRFITLEGVEGVGKSTNLEVIKDFLAAHHVPFLHTREPGGTEIAEKIRDLLLASHEEPMQDMTELLLVFAARAQHLDTLIRPALARGEWVLCDRFTDATVAYQGGGRGLDREVIASLRQLVQGELTPDLTIVLDLSPEIGLQRAGGRGELDRFEREELPFFNRVRAAYLALCEQEPGRCQRIDASGSAAQVRHRLEAVLQDRLGPWLAAEEPIA